MRQTLTALAAATMAGLAITAAPASAAPHDDGHGRLWRQVDETRGHDWTRIASLCPTDGTTACAGMLSGQDITGWVWATQQQVMDLFNRVLPPDPQQPNNGQLSVAHPSIGGLAYGFIADAYIGPVFRPTFSFCITYQCGESLSGWTATRSGPDGAFLGGAGWSTNLVSFDGGFSVGDVRAIDAGNAFNGVWLWQATTAPIPEPASLALLALGLAAVGAGSGLRRRAC